MDRRPHSGLRRSLRATLSVPSQQLCGPWDQLGATRGLPSKPSVRFPGRDSRVLTQGTEALMVPKSIIMW